MVASTPTERKEWFDRGVADGATHMLVVTDTYDWEDYPVYVPHTEYGRDDKGELAQTVTDDVEEVYRRYHGPNMQRVMEVIDLRQGRERVDTPGYKTDGLPPDVASEHKRQVEGRPAAILGELTQAFGDQVQRLADTLRSPKD